MSFALVVVALRWLSVAGNYGCAHCLRTNSKDQHFGAVGTHAVSILVKPVSDTSTLLNSKVK